jgi:hAT family C-terminal dimerisation region
LQKVRSVCGRLCERTSDVTCVSDPARQVRFAGSASSGASGVVTGPPGAFRQGIEYFDESSSDSAPSGTSESTEAFIFPTSDEELRRIAAEQLDAFRATEPKSTEDALLWWKSTGTRLYWMLAPVARWCFSILASSAPVERIFKCAKYVTREERGRTGDELVDALAVLAYTFRKFPELYHLYIETGRLHDVPSFVRPTGARALSTGK